MKRLIPALLSAILLLATLTACDHKELCYTHPHFSTVRVAFDWSRVTETERPEGMRVHFYPTNATGKVWIFDFPGGRDATIEIPQNNYRVICFNYDVEGVTWRSDDHFDLMTATTPTVTAPDNESASLTPSILIGHSIAEIGLSDIPEGEERTVTLTPTRMTCRYTYEVRGLQNTGQIAEIRASLSGMADELIMADDRLPHNRSERLLFGGSLSGKNVVGGFYTFGRSSDPDVRHTFRLYIKSRTGDVHIISHDVTEQVRTVPTIGHLADVHLVIDTDFTIPIEPGTGSGSDAGFDVGVDDWDDENSDIEL